jgi:hypothetical protein
MNRPAPPARPIAWHGRPDLKAEVGARLRAHRVADEIVQGHYQRESNTPNGYVGCALGCTLPLYSASTRREYNCATGFQHGWWKRIEDEYGIPARVAKLIDNTFEAQPTFEAAADFAVAVIDAVPVGADLDAIFDLWLDDEMEYAHPGPAAAWLLEHLAAAPIREPVGAGR